MPLIQFTTSSNDIEAVSGTYSQGHEFILEPGAIVQGNEILIRYNNPDRVDATDVHINTSTPNLADVNTRSDAQGDYNVLSFIQADDTFSLTLSVYDYYVDDIVELLKIKVG